MLTRWDMVPFASAESPDRHLLKVKGDAAGVRRLVSLFPKIAQEPFQIRGGDFDWGIYVAGASGDARKQLGAYLDELIESGGEEPADESTPGPDPARPVPAAATPPAAAVPAAPPGEPRPARARLTYLFPRGEETVAAELSTNVASSLRRAAPHVTLGESELRAYDPGEGPPLVDGAAVADHGGVVVVLVPGGTDPAARRGIEQAAGALGSVGRALSGSEAGRWYIRAELAGAAALSARPGRSAHD